MQITLNQDEILAALDDYVRTCISIPTGNTITIDLKAGRGDNGFSATLDIVPSNTMVPKPKPVTRAVSEAPAPVEEAPASVAAPEPKPTGLFGSKAVEETTAAVEDDIPDETTAAEEPSAPKSIFSKRA